MLRKGDRVVLEKHLNVSNPLYQLWTMISKFLMLVTYLHSQRKSKYVEVAWYNRSFAVYYRNNVGDTRRTSFKDMYYAHAEVCIREVSCSQQTACQILAMPAKHLLNFLLSTQTPRLHANHQETRQTHKTETS